MLSEPLGNPLDSTQYTYMTFIFCLFAVFLFAVIILRPRTRNTSKRVTIVVLGDIGRSPRMQYHAQSLAKLGFQVDFIGYLDSMPLKDIVDCDRIELHDLYRLGIPDRTIFMPIKLTEIQNPPALPTLIAGYAASRLTNATFIIDWHNLAYSILRLKLPAFHPFVIASTYYERILGRLCDISFCVTHKMNNFLRQEFGITSPIYTLHDRPASQFSPLSVEQKLIYRKLFKETQNVEPGTRILISSTSYTPDEDFSILLDALKIYDLNPGCPKVLVLITGKGPLKEYYRNLVSKIPWRKVQIEMPWLESEDYPRVLACCDLAVCLHTSSSGLDLPMKILDFFGSGIPGSIDSSIDELIKDGVNGRIFSDAKELAALELMSDDCKLVQMREDVISGEKKSWDKAWTDIAQPIFE
ncbi:Chitobiosyldiphosphodolichol beta-mannosyltransferase [Neolecta irregularis DAH-3]|uniref:Chitobiosyldiphosphodolichol beta-mannosyltransferase n=1 Tax=Neolecta irregularis (strain DAH-3) TaxID=1198029 RepID=A0A1U7LKI7_NEOID|nr:Chitobiosyldiphosphodolichol beta-mannosyltransferase [Neolecta irregularis DAH-3]|eukprot:OLL23159.1 Chitobiosyldiphosphodolichol beta-mannosyltransferase [Neolecta irregularis DAH-3]